MFTRFAQKVVQEGAKGAAHIASTAGQHTEKLAVTAIAGTTGFVVNQIIKGNKRWDGYTNAEKLEAINRLNPGDEAGRLL